jgi:hypothetical protein
MTTTFVNIPPDTLRQALSSAGFTRNPAVRAREEVWDFVHKRDARYIIRVYTTIPLVSTNPSSGTSSSTSSSTRVRACGNDAIRVVAICAKASPSTEYYGVYKGRRVHRCGSIDGVVSRMLERAREAYRACNQRLAGSSLR